MIRPPMRIRPFRDSDLEALCAIDRVCFDPDIAFPMATLEFHVRHPKSITRVGEDSGRILGFVLASVETASCAHVLTLDVVPEARRRRIGLSLMRTLHRALKRRNLGAVFLEVGVRNLPAQRLYEALKYEYLDTVYGYYPGGEDAVRMARFF